VSLTSLSISTTAIGDLFNEELTQFIESHTALTSFTFSVIDYIPIHGFFRVYEHLLTSVSRNKGINVLNLNCNVIHGEYTVSLLAMRISELSRILEGRDILINGVNVDRIINDLQRNDQTALEILAVIKIGNSTRFNSDF